MRASLLALVALVALCAAAPAAAVCAADASVHITAAGPQPAAVHVTAGSLVQWSTGGLGTSRVVFESSPCSPVQVDPLTVVGCVFDDGGEFAYRVEGFGAGTGIVTVDPARWITVRASRRVVLFGQAVTLRGLAHRGNECGPPRVDPPRVRVWGRGPVGPRRVTAAPAIFPPNAFHGESPWSARVSPRIGTTYVAEWHGRTASLRVDVRPRVTLRRVAGGRLRTTVRSGRTYRGRWAAVQRRTGRGWRFERAVRLGAGSAATFRAPRGSGPVRVVVPARRGYVRGWSRAL
jgi:hypothetical protein